MYCKQNLFLIIKKVKEWKRILSISLVVSNQKIPSLVRNLQFRIRSRKFRALSSKISLDLKVPWFYKLFYQKLTIYSFELMTQKVGNMKMLINMVPKSCNLTNPISNFIFIKKLRSQNSPSFLCLSYI